MKWIVDGSEYDDIGDAVSAVIDAIEEDAYEEHLDGVYGDIDVCGIEYAAGMVFKEIDPTAFYVGFADWTASLNDEVQGRLEEMDEGDDELIFGVSVEVLYDEDDDEEDDDEEDDGDDT